MDMYTTASQCYGAGTTHYTNGDYIYPETVVPAEHIPFYQPGSQWDSPEAGSCLEALERRLAVSGGACSPQGQLLSLLRDEDVLRVTGAKPLNALFREAGLRPGEAAAVKLRKRRLRKRLAKRGWDRKERTRDQAQRAGLRQLGEQRERLRREREQLIAEIEQLETLLNKQ